MKEPKRTEVSVEEVHLQYERKGFYPVCIYASLKPEKNEIGGIFKSFGKPRMERGLFVCESECVERIFIKQGE